MSISTFDLFKIGIGPSSSHTVAPMKAARLFVGGLAKANLLQGTERVKSEMFGSLGATGLGHGTPKAVLLGLEGETPEFVDIDGIESRIEAMRADRALTLEGGKKITFTEEEDLVLHRRKSLPTHPNGMRFTAFDSNGVALQTKVYYSVGGGFVLDEQAVEEDQLVVRNDPLPYPFKSGTKLLELCKQHDLSISQLMLENEKAWRTEQEISDGLQNIWQVMQTCMENGLKNTGILPGGLKVKRRAPDLHEQLITKREALLADPLAVLDWVTLYALAINEENAAGGRVVTAPTNGAAGIIPAVLHYYMRCVPGANDKGMLSFLLTAAAIGTLYKENASISGAEVGCQGEIGSACSMAAGALCEVMGGTAEQVENAAEIAMEHNLGLTCDPVGGLVQVPCIERNAMASVKAIHAARMSLKGDGSHLVSLDMVIKTMRDTGRDMKEKYKETSRGGLALNVIEVPVSIIEC
ncbi:MAG: L-serine ammonia-lyase [Pseudomonadales bacterium]